jgi:hypothetical protein
VDEEVAAPVASQGDQGGGNSPGPLLHETIPGPRRRGGDHGLPVDVSLSFARVAAALSKFDSALADRGRRTRPPLSQFDSPSRGPATRAGPRRGPRNRIPIFVAPPFAPVAFGDAGDSGALFELFLIPMLPADRPALVASSAIG